MTGREAYLPEISCAIFTPDRRSQRNEHIRASDPSRARICRGISLRGISLGVRAERRPTIASARPHGREPSRPQLRGYDDCVGQLRSRCSCAVAQRTRSGRSIFENSGVDSAVGRIAVSWRMHFRACASCSLDHLVDRAVPCSMLIRRRSRIYF